MKTAGSLALRFVVMVLMVLTLIPGAGVARAAGPQPDLVVTDLKTAVMDGGVTLDIQFNIKNQGTAAAPASYAEIKLAGRAIQTYPINPLAAGASQAVELKTSNPTQDTEVLITADSKKQVDELHESNNKSSVHVAGARLPDLVVERVKIEQTKLTPAEIKVTLRVKNQGKAPTAAAFWVKAWQPENPGYPEMFTVSNPLGQGQSQEFQFTSTPLGFNPCTFIAEVDPDNKVAELNEGNNRKSDQEKIKVDSKLPDLTLRLDKVGLYRDGNGKVAGLSLEYDIANASKIDVKTQITFEIRYNSGKIPNVKFPLELSHPAGKSNHWTTGTSLGGTPSDLFGTSVTLIVDPDNNIVEANKANNSVALTVPDPIKRVLPIEPMLPAELMR